jgi:hypothetical protein
MMFLDPTKVTAVLKFLLILGILIAGNIKAAIPDSIAGYTYHLNYFVRSPMSNDNNKCIEFGAGGHFSERYSHESILAGGTPDGHPLFDSTYELPVSGNYEYEKTTDSSAKLTMITDNWVVSFTLQFNTDLAGSAVRSGVIGNFFLIKPSVDQRPLSAIATRVRVRPGDNTIIGFRVERGGDFLLRVGGPVLKSLGVDNVWEKPRFSLYDGKSQKVTIWQPGPTYRISRAMPLG